MSKKLEFLIIWYDTKLTNIMQSFDVFEKFKVVGKHEVIEATVDDKITAEMMFGLIKDNWSKMDCGLAALVSIDEPKYNFVDENIKAVSTGEKWGTVDAILDFYGVGTYIRNEKKSLEVIDEM